MLTDRLKSASVESRICVIIGLDGSYSKPRISDNRIPNLFYLISQNRSKKIYYRQGHLKINKDIRDDHFFNFVRDRNLHYVLKAL